MYYLQDIKMEVIAKPPQHLPLHRLASDQESPGDGAGGDHARPSEHRAPGLGADIAATYGIDTYVVPVPDSDEHIDRLDQVSITTARLLGRGSTPT